MKCSEQNYQKLVLSIFIIYFANWFYQGHFLFQLHQPTLKITGIDNTYWLFCILRIPQIIIQYALLIDILLVIFLIISFSTKNKWSFRCLMLLIIVHVITFNIYAGVHTKSCIILPIVILPYCFPKQQHLLNDGARYYLMFIFVSAAIYKLVNGGLFNEHQFVHILENQHTDLAILEPTHYTYQISIWLIKHPLIADSLWFLFTLSEFIFIIGFFTKKYDFMLIILMIGIMVSTYILMRISLFDFILFLPLLINNQQRAIKSNS